MMKFVAATVRKRKAGTRFADGREFGRQVGQLMCDQVNDFK
jgi:hypothetical protein